MEGCLAPTVGKQTGAGKPRSFDCDRVGMLCRAVFVIR